MRSRAWKSMVLGLAACSCSCGLPLAEEAFALDSGSPTIAGTAQESGASRFLGSWRNPVTWTRGIVRIDVHDDLGTLKVRVWGRCHPDNCDWGEKVPETFIAHSTSKIIALRLTYGRDHEGIGKDLLLRLEPGPQLRAETYTTFTDSRPPYWAAYFLVPESRDTKN